MQQQNPREMPQLQRQTSQAGVKPARCQSSHRVQLFSIQPVLVSPERLRRTHPTSGAPYCKHKAEQLSCYNPRPPCDMPVFVEDPAHFSKSRLRSDLVAHNVELPPGKSKKEVYVQLYLKHIGTKNAADFSSDEEDQAQDGAGENPEKADVRDPSCMTDDELRATLLAHGVKAGPIVASTRALYEKVSRMLHSDGHNRLNGTDKGTLYSDSEEDEESGEEEENEGDEDAELGAEEEEETVEQSDQAQQESSQLPEEPVKDTFKEMFSDTETTPTGICATRRRPIKGAAGRPIQYAYPDTPVSPTTAERREVERRLVPISVQILVFLFVVCVLYLICVGLCDNPLSPFVALLDSLYQGLDGEEGLLLQMEAQDTQAAYGQE